MTKKTWDIAVVRVRKCFVSVYLCSCLSILFLALSFFAQLAALQQHLVYYYLLLIIIPVIYWYTYSNIIVIHKGDCIFGMIYHSFIFRSDTSYIAFSMFEAIEFYSCFRFTCWWYSYSRTSATHCCQIDKWSNNSVSFIQNILLYYPHSSYQVYIRHYMYRTYISLYEINML